MKGRVRYYDWSTYTLMSWGLYILLAWMHWFSWVYVGVIYLSIVLILMKTRPMSDVFKFSFIYIIGLLLLIGYMTLSWFSNLYDAFWTIHAVRVATRIYRSVAMLIN